MNPVAVSPPSRTDPFLRGASEAIGGPIGRHSRQASTRLILSILALLTASTCLFGWVQKAPCLNHAWSGEYQYTRMCYSDVFALYYSEGLAAGQVPYAQAPVEYPVVIGGLMAVAADVAHLAPPARRGPAFFDITALMLAGAALVVTWTTARLAGRRRIWDAAMVAVAPTLLLHAYTNWDLAAVALTGAGLLMWARGRPVWAGVAIGLGTATKLYPVLLVLPLFLLAVRTRQLRAVTLTALAGVLAWLLVDLPIWLAWPSAFARFWSLNTIRPADWDTLWYAVSRLSGRPLALDTLNVGVALATVAVFAAVSVLALRAPRRPRLAQLAFLVLAGFLLVNKVDSPQYVLWLLPLAVLARPRWPAFLGWQATEVVLLFFRFYFFVSNDKPGQGVGYPWFLTAVLVRDAALIILLALVVREILHPERDVVRAGGDDDPAWPALPVGSGVTQFSS